MPANPSDLKKEFQEMFRDEPLIVQAPGRVNLIGEHTDYNDGFVLPAAIQFRASVAVSPNPERKIRIFSKNYSEETEFDLENLPGEGKRHWSDYIVAVVRELKKNGPELAGANLLIDGDVPQGAGLSSSAALEVAVCRAFLELLPQTMDGVAIAQLCQRAESEFVGTRCGIMDQFVSVHGKKDHALLLDCRSLHHELQPIPASIRLLVCNTMVRHTHAGGEYNQRRKECEAAVNYFAEKKGHVKALRDVSMKDFQELSDGLPPLLRRRALHVISENHRTVQASYALVHHDLKQFGQLMAESHTSLRDNYEVSCKELDVLVDLANGLDGVYGARMTGGGFGGCTVNLVESAQVESVRTRISQGYERATGKTPEIYVCTPADGAGPCLI